MPGQQREQAAGRLQFALAEIKGKTYAELLRVPAEKLRSLAVQLPHPGHTEPVEIALKNGKKAFLRRVLLTPHDLLKPPSSSTSAWLKKLSPDERLGHDFYEQHKKLFHETFSSEEAMYPEIKQWLVEQLALRLPPNHVKMPARVEHIVAHDEKNRLLGFITVESTQNNTGVVGYVAVNPAYRRSGLAEHLHKAAWKRFDELGVPYVIGETERYGDEEKREHDSLVEKSKNEALSKKESRRLAWLDSAKSRLMALSKHGWLHAEDFPQYYPGFDRKITLLVKPIRGKETSLSGRKLLWLVKDMHGNERIYGNDLSAVRRISNELRRSERAGVTRFKLAPLLKE